jgi:hypothetical protein
MREAGKPRVAYHRAVRPPQGKKYVKPVGVVPPGVFNQVLG